MYYNIYIYGEVRSVAFVSKEITKKYENMDSFWQLMPEARAR